MCSTRVEEGWEEKGVMEDSGERWERRRRRNGRDLSPIAVMVQFLTPQVAHSTNKAPDYNGEPKHKKPNAYILKSWAFLSFSHTPRGGTRDSSDNGSGRKIVAEASKNLLTAAN